MGGKPRVSPTLPTTEKAGPPKEPKIPLGPGLCFSSTPGEACELVERWISGFGNAAGVLAVQPFLLMADCRKLGRFQGEGGHAGASGSMAVGEQSQGLGEVEVLGNVPLSGAPLTTAHSLGRAILS